MEDAASSYVIPGGIVEGVWGSGWAKIKWWEDQGNAWRMSRKQVRVMGLDATMSPSSQGYYVMDDQEKFFYSADLVQGAEPPPLPCRSWWSQGETLLRPGEVKEEDLRKEESTGDSRPEASAGGGSF